MPAVWDLIPSDESLAAIRHPNAQEKSSTADDEFDYTVRDTWRRHLWALAREGIDTTTRVWKLRYWSKSLAELTLDEDDDVLEAAVEDDCISDGYGGMEACVDSSSED